MIPNYAFIDITLGGMVSVPGEVVPMSTCVHIKVIPTSLTSSLITS